MWTAADQTAGRGVGVDFGDRIADERDRWCMPNGINWTIVPDGLDQSADDRLIIVLDSEDGPRVVGPTTYFGWVSIAGLEAITRLGRFEANLVVQYSDTALRIADALLRAVAEQEEHRRSWADDDSSDPGAAAGGGVLDREEIVALLDARPKPDWIRGLSANAQRLCALIDAAVEGRKWATPYVFPDGSDTWRYQEVARVGLHYGHWQAILGGSWQEVRMAAMSLHDAWGAGSPGGDGRWCFDGRP